MAKSIRNLFILSLTFGLVVPHKFSFSSCPIVDPMQSFDVNPFLGKWFIIETFRSINTCMTLSFEDDPADSTLRVVQAREILPLDQLNIHHISKYEGQLTLDNNNSSSMTVRWPANIFGSASFFVLDTDYSSYALLFECQKIFRFSRRSITILSRQSTLDSAITAEVKEKIRANRLDASALKKVDQTDCITEDESDISFTVNEETFGGRLPAVDTDIFEAVGTEEDFLRLLNMEKPIPENLINPPE